MIILQWLKWYFDSATHKKAKGQYRLLIYNGYSSHYTSEFLSHTIEHKILYFILVLHFSHLTQPLDATIFGPLTCILSGITTPLFQLGIGKMQKLEGIEFYYQVHNQTFIKNIKSDFSSTSIYSINANKVVNRIRSITVSLVTEDISIPASPLPLLTIPTSQIISSFPIQILTSSPMDFTILQAANTILNCMVDTTPLPTLTCKQRWPGDEYTRHSPRGTHFMASQADIGLVRRATRRGSAKYSGTCDESLKVFYLSKQGE